MSSVKGTAGLLLIVNIFKDFECCHLLSAIVSYCKSVDSYRLHEPTETDVFQRFGHSLVVADEFIYVVGGYSKSRHRDNVVAKIGNGGRWRSKL
jgi:hypothetical protein